MKNVHPGTTALLGVLWVAGALAFVPAWEGRSPRRASVAAAISIERPSPASSRVSSIAPSSLAAPPEDARATAIVGWEVSPPPSPAIAARPGPSGIAEALAELEGCLGGPDFAPTMENVRRSLVPLLASDPRAVEDALARALDLRAAGEARAVLIEALAASPGASRAADIAPALLMDPSPLVRDAAWRHLESAR